MRVAFPSNRGSVEHVWRSRACSLTFCSGKAEREEWPGVSGRRRLLPAWGFRWADQRIAPYRTLSHLIAPCPPGIALYFFFGAGSEVGVQASFGSGCFTLFQPARPRKFRSIQVTATKMKKNQEGPEERRKSLIPMIISAISTLFLSRIGRSGQTQSNPVKPHGWLMESRGRF
jgi:hypothetical protein